MSLDERLKELIKEKDLTQERFKQEVRGMQTEMDACKNDHYNEGTYPKIKKFLTRMLVVTASIFTSIAVLMILLVVAACYVVRKGPIKDEFAEKYDEKRDKRSRDKSEKSRLMSKRLQKSGRFKGSGRSKGSRGISKRSGKASKNSDDKTPNRSGRSKNKSERSPTRSKNK